LWPTVSLIWFIEVDGLPMDARPLPLDLQTVAFRRRYIPYIPTLGREGTAALMQSVTQPTRSFATGNGSEACRWR
jgi:hypothetical protein